MLGLLMFTGVEDLDPWHRGPCCQRRPGSFHPSGFGDVLGMARLLGPHLLASAHPLHERFWRRRARQCVGGIDWIGPLLPLLPWAYSSSGGAVAHWSRSGLPVSRRCFDAGRKVGASKIDSCIHECARRGRLFPCTHARGFRKTYPSAPHKAVRTGMAMRDRMLRG